MFYLELQPITQMKCNFMFFAMTKRGLFQLQTKSNHCTVTVLEIMSHYNKTLC